MEDQLKKYLSYLPFAADTLIQHWNSYVKTFPPDELSGIDLEKEYELIQQKKSKLSKRLRDKIVNKYE